MSRPTMRPSTDSTMGSSAGAVAEPVQDANRSRIHPPVTIVRQPLDPRISRRWTIAVDMIAMVAAIAVLVAIAADVRSPGRAVGTLLVAVLVPGWTVCRWCGWQYSAATLLTSIAISVAVIVLVGQIVVTRTEWNLESVGAVLTAVCLAALGLVHGVRGMDV